MRVRKAHCTATSPVASSAGCGGTGGSSSVGANEILLDSGAKIHLMPHRGLLHDVSPLPAGCKVQWGEGNCSPATAQGLLRLLARPSSSPVSVTRVWLVPEATLTLLSVSLLTDRGVDVCFRRNRAIIQLDGAVIMTALCRSGMYCLDVEPLWSSPLSAAAAAASSSSPLLAPAATSSAGSNAGGGGGSNSTSDTAGSQSCGGASAPPAALARPAQTAAAAAMEMDMFVQLEARQLQGLKVRQLQSDRGGEYVSAQLEQWLQQNGTAERLNHTLQDRARALLDAADLPPSFWPYAISTAAGIRNLSPSAGRPVTP
ncbi:Retrovirus-related Pol polyprotein from transposon [Tetrabaena socialis]|uniref:Retrovirus-related Pol polyprotein from transposon n=1 Tax=Tetrabaena socialis TaxID=47790 RepID=A0A2J7ZUE5_9CHLO|nr:Retrovirus-related Pol polyprotein from transposon [Tetrabaena socialis]|eukprot:PNH03903.1 Retrovirus-related Pol polyprotein from transposon [Tetrabaena socialis]